ncbi:MAG: flagellar hook-basal body complex protein FliE [Lachnospiraceae bacterium]|nr:flagellar hook-basal body complex protein FliE [Lachnospiraceae bacterium]
MASSDIYSIGGITPVSNMSELLLNRTKGKEAGGISSFEALLNSAMGMIKETEDYSNAAEEAEMAYMLGLNDSVSDLLIAQTKANVTLQYTVAVRNAVIEAYKELMQMQF